MRGLILLFLSIVGFGLFLQYADKSSKGKVFKFVSKNLLTILFAILAVAIAIFLSVNTTMRFV